MPGFAHAYSLPQLRAYLMRVNAAAPAAKFRVVYHAGISDVDMLDELIAVCRLACIARNVVLGIDELWMFCSSANFAGIPKALKSVTLTGRHYGVTILYTAQQPGMISTPFRSTASKVFCFRISPRDFDTVKQDFQIPEDLRAEITRLPDRVCYVRDERYNWGRQ